jgi:antitoxin (DNA-binding transcriptional repressor) of toxin-antitoxin stability system
MTITVKVGEAKTHLSDLLVKVEAGEEVIIARGNDPIARLTRIHRESDVRAVIEEIRAARAKAKPVTTDEILAWRHEGHRY